MIGWVFIGAGWLVSLFAAFCYGRGRVIAEFRTLRSYRARWPRIHDEDL